MSLVAVRLHDTWVYNVDAIGFLEIYISFNIFLHLNQINRRTSSNIELQRVIIIVVSGKIYSAVESLSHSVLLN